MIKYHAKSTIKVLYITGYGHSGSTFIDTALGNQVDTISVGELSNMYQYVWEGSKLCGCGQKASECFFWQDVKKNWRRRIGKEFFHGYFKRQQAYEKWRDPFNWYRLTSENKRQSFDFKSHIKQTHALYEAIHEVSGKSLIIDSSKIPTQAMFLSMVKGLDLSLLHLVRDARGICWSSIKKAERVAKRQVSVGKTWITLLRAIAGWSLANLESELIARRMPKGHTMLMRYEDFVINPDKMLEKLGVFTKRNFESVIKKVHKREILDKGHAIAGNRLRKKVAIRLQPDFEWKEKMPRRYKILCHAMTALLLSRYGYI